MARIGVEAGGGVGRAGIGVVGARSAWRLAGLAGDRDVVARVGVEAGGLARGGLVGARSASSLSCRSCTRNIISS